MRLIAGDAPATLALKDKIGVGPSGTLPVGNTYIAGVAAPTALTITNTDSVAHDVTVQPIITDWEEKQVPATSLGTFSVPASGTTAVTYNIDTSRRGAFHLGFDLSCEGQTWRQLADLKYAVVVNMQGVGNPDTSLFAINTHMEREPTPHLTREMQVVATCGVKWIRAWWGWGMCEKTEGTFDFTEYDRQYNAVSGAQLRVMPILLRYYTSVGSFKEQSWAGPTTPGAIQEYPYTSQVPEFGVWAGKVAQHYAGNVKAYEIWNEPTTGSSPNGVLTPAQYAALLNAATPAIRSNDPNAKVVAFAGVPTSFIQQTLALNTAAEMDILSDHAYAETMLPDKNYPIQMENIKAAMQSGGAGGKPIWHSEQGIVGDGDGYSVPMVSETDIAQLYTRNVVTAASQGSKNFFWFSVDNTPTFGFMVFYGDYIPRPRLAALNACASFLEGFNYQKSYTPAGANTYAYLFQGTNAAVCVVWNSVTGMSLALPIAASKVQAFDTMGNALAVGGTTSTTIQIPPERPTFLQCAAADSSALDSALGSMQVTSVSPVTITASPIVGGVQVTLTGTLTTAADGIVSLISIATPAPTGWPAPQHFVGIAEGQSQTFQFPLPAKPAVKSVQVVCGDRRLQTITVPYGVH